MEKENNKDLEGLQLQKDANNRYFIYIESMDIKIYVKETDIPLSENIGKYFIFALFAEGVKATWAEIVKEVEAPKNNMLSIHICNGGFNFSVEKLSHNDTHIPVLNIMADSHGHKMNEMKINMTPDQLKTLGEFLINKANNANTYYNDNRKDNGWNGMANNQLINK